ADALERKGPAHVSRADPAQRLGRQLIAFAWRAGSAGETDDRFAQHRLHQLSLALTRIPALAHAAGFRLLPLVLVDLCDLCVTAARPGHLRSLLFFAVVEPGSVQRTCHAPAAAARYKRRCEAMCQNLPRAGHPGRPATQSLGAWAWRSVLTRGS